MTSESFLSNNTCASASLDMVSNWVEYFFSISFTKQYYSHYVANNLSSSGIMWATGFRSPLHKTGLLVCFVWYNTSYQINKTAFWAHKFILELILSRLPSELSIFYQTFLPTSMSRPPSVKKLIIWWKEHLLNLVNKKYTKVLWIFMAVAKWYLHC